MSNIVNRIVMHHSAGWHAPSALDRQHYHRIVGGDGTVVSGSFPISANAIGRKLSPGAYAAHTLNLNGGAIGLAMSCMAGAEWHIPRACAAFPRPVQVEAFIAEAARLASLYSIPITRQSVLSHAEVQITLGVTQRGKWDFDYDPFGIIDTRDPIAIGDMLRDKIRAALPQSPVIETPIAQIPRPILRRGAIGPAVGDLQRLLGIPQDLMFGPATQAALIAHQKAHQLVADGIAGAAVWASLTKGK